MHVLIVEDNQVSQRLMKDKLTEWGYTVSSAHNGAEAWQRIESLSVDIVVSDWKMPEMDGLELCRRIRSADLEFYIYFILVTAQDSEEDIVQGLSAGADDYVTKPVKFDELRARMGIGDRIVRLERELTGKYKAIEENYLQTIRMFTNLMEVFNEGLGGHSRRVAELSLKLATRHPGVSEQDYPLVEAAGLLHDIGMVGLPNDLLCKKRTELTGEEHELYLSHPVLGENILKQVEFLRPVAKLVRAHHEQVNGRGFPDGLNGDEIPLLARIVTAAVAYDNLIYKGKVPLEEIPDNFRRFRGYQLDPAIVDQLLEINLENIQKEKGENFREIDLESLIEGMELARDVWMKNGALAMPADTEITDYGIEKLKKYYDLNYIPNTVYVFKNTVRG